MIESMIQYIKANPVVVIFILGLFFVKKNKKSEVGVLIQSKIFEEIIETLSAFKIENIEINALPDQDKKEKFDSLNKKTIHTLQKCISSLEIAGSYKIKSWITEKLSSSLNGTILWLTDANIDELCLMIRLELAAAPWHERLRYVIKNWLLKK